METPRDNPSEPLPLPHAGFWIRSIAGIIDLILLIVPFAVFISFFAAATGISNPFFNHRAGTPLNETLTQSGPTFLFICLCFFAVESWLYYALSESSRLARNSRKALLRHLCSRRRRQTNRFLASQPAFLQRTSPSASCQFWAATIS